MPPDSSAGLSSPISGPSPTAASFCSAISRACCRGMPRPWISPNATFSHTLSESNRALPWNSMPKRRISLSRAARPMPIVSTPSMRIDPASGRISPRMHLIRTDFPTPEPPMMTRLSPAAQSISTPSSTRLGPKDFSTPLTAIFGTGALVLIARRTPGSENSLTTGSGSRPRQPHGSSPDRPPRRRRANSSPDSSPSARR